MLTKQASISNTTSNVASAVINVQHKNHQHSSTNWYNQQMPTGVLSVFAKASAGIVHGGIISYIQLICSNVYLI